MADMGLAALSGIMRGFGGFPEGLQTGEEARMRREQMEEANRARMAQEQFQQAQLAQTLGLQKETMGLRRDQLAETQRHQRVLEQLGILPYTTPKATAPAPFKLGPGQQMFSPEGKPIATGGPVSPPQSAIVDVQRNRMRGEGWQPGPAFDIELGKRMERLIPVGAGGAVFTPTGLLGSAPDPGMPQPTQGPKPVLERPVTPPAVGAEQVTNLADFRTLLGQLGKVRGMSREGRIGPVQGYLGAVRGFTGVRATEGEAELRAELASIQNSLIYLKSGKQINEKEYARLRRELPEVTDPEPVFKAKLDRAETLLQEMLKNREAELAARGYRGTGPPPSPSGWSIRRR